MAGFLTWDVERSFREWVEAEIDLPLDGAERVVFHWNGETFDARADKMVQPRLTAFQRGPGGERFERGVGFDAMTLSITCAVQLASAGSRFGELSRLVDEVRRITDGSLRATAFKVTDGSNEVIGFGEFEETQEQRLFDQSIVIEEREVARVDLAVLTTRVRLHET